MSEAPSKQDLLRVAALADLFDAPDFIAGQWVRPEPSQAGVITLGYWCPTGAVAEWNQALHDCGIIDPQSDYLSEETSEYVRRAVDDASIVRTLDLVALRRILTFLARAERRTEGGWYEPAFASGMAQAATRRLGQLARTGT